MPLTNKQLQPSKLSVIVGKYVEAAFIQPIELFCSKLSYILIIQVPCRVLWIPPQAQQILSAKFFLSIFTERQVQYCNYSLYSLSSITPASLSDATNKCWI